MSADSSSIEQDYIVNAAIKKYMLPTILSMVSIPLTQAADAIIIGSFMGERGLGAVSVVAPLFMVYEAISELTGLGGSILYNISRSRGDNAGAQRVFNTSLFTAVVFSLLLCLSAVFIMPMYADALSAKGELRELSIQYGTVLLMAAPLIVGSQVTACFIRSDNEPATAFKGVLITNVLNIVLDIVFMGYLDMGIKGAAFAIMIGSAASLVFYFASYKRRFARIDLRAYSLNKLMSVLQAGSPSISSCFGGAVLFSVSNMVFLRTVGAQGAALNTTVNSVFCLMQYIYLGAIFSLMPAVSTFYGEGDFKKQAATGRAILRYSLIISAVLGCVMLAFAERIAGIYGLTDLELMRNTAYSIRVSSVALVFDAFIMFITQYNTSVERDGFSNAVFLFKNIFCGVPCIMLFGYMFGINGVWYGRTMSLILTVLFVVAVSFATRKKNTRPFLLTPIELHEFNKIYFSVENNQKSLDRLFVTLREFCKNNSIDDKKTLFIQILIEEVFVNTCTHGIKDDKTHYIDVLVKTEQDLTTIRIRDDGEPFNPLEVELSDEIDLDNADNLGIRFLRGLSKTQKYDRIIGFNNLVVTF